MDKNLHNIDDAFRNGFQNWEPDFSNIEMQQDWNSLSQQVPAPSQPNTGTGGSSAQFGLGAGKIAGIIGTAAVVVTSTILIFNITKNNSPSTQSISIKPLTEIEVNSPENVGDQKNELLTDSENNSEKDKGLNSVKSISSNQYGNTQSKDEKKVSVDNNSTFNVKDFETRPSETYNKETDNLLNSNTTQNDNINANTLQFAFGDSVICLNTPFIINNIDRAANKPVTIQWGDGKTERLNVVTRAHYYTKPGWYTITLTDEKQSITKQVRVLSRQEISFDARALSELQYRFVINSNKHAAYRWDFGDGSEPEYNFNPVHNYAAEGDYIVKMIGYSQNGCSDTFIRSVQVKKTGELILYNIFTPNGDNKNDVFMAEAKGSLETFHIEIFDPVNGQTVFESNRLSEGWNGNFMNTGPVCKEGTYYYIIRYRFAGGEKMLEKKGQLTLNR